MHDFANHQVGFLSTVYHALNSYAIGPMPAVLISVTALHSSAQLTPGIPPAYYMGHGDIGIRVDYPIKQPPSTAAV